MAEFVGKAMSPILGVDGGGISRGGEIIGGFATTFHFAKSTFHFAKSTFDPPVLKTLSNTDLLK